MVHLKKSTDVLNNKKAQILMIGGIIMCVMIVLSSVASISLTNIAVSIDKTTFIKSEFECVKDKFGLLLNDRLSGKLNNITFIYSSFNYSRDLLSFAEARHNNYFNAEFVEMTYTADEADGMIVDIILSNKNDYIKERVAYYIE